MRMSGDYFWGLLFIVAGIALIVRYVFNINVPVVRIILGFIMIYFGVTLIAGGFIVKNKNDIIFSDGNINAADVRDEYNIIFGNGTINLTKSKMTNRNGSIEVNTIFARGMLRIEEGVPAVIKVDSAFAGAHFPDGTTISFGNYTYRTKAYREGEPFILINADVVFGQLNIEEAR